MHYDRTRGIRYDWHRHKHEKTVWPFYLPKQKLPAGFCDICRWPSWSCGVIWVMSALFTCQWPFWLWVAMLIMCGHSGYRGRFGYEWPFWLLVAVLVVSGHSRYINYQHTVGCCFQLCFVKTKTTYSSALLQLFRGFCLVLDSCFRDGRRQSTDGWVPLAIHTWLQADCFLFDREIRKRLIRLNESRHPFEIQNIGQTRRADQQPVSFPSSKTGSPHRCYKIIPQTVIPRFICSS